VSWSSPFVWFLVFVFIVWGGIFIFLRRVLATLSKRAAEHADSYAGAYLKGSALIAIAVLNSFKQTFQALSPDVAAVLPWWSWLGMFFEPVIAGLAVYMAFTDGTMKEIRDVRADEEGKEK